MIKFRNSQKIFGFKIVNLVAVVGLLLVLLSITPNSSAQNSKTTKDKADSNSRSSARVNPATFAMEFSLPLGSYPGRGGSSTPIAINYSSKVWGAERFNHENEEFDASLTLEYGYGPATPSFSEIVYIVSDIMPRFSEKAIAGWNSSLKPASILEEEDNYDQYGNPFKFVLLPWQESSSSFCDIILEVTTVPSETCLSGQATSYTTFCGATIAGPCVAENIEIVENGEDPESAGGPPPVPQVRHQVKRYRVSLPNGSSHEFRKEDNATDCSAFPTSCNGDPEAGTYLSVDGSGLRLERQVDYGNGEFRDELYMPNGSKYIFYPYEGVLTNLEHTLVEKYIDVNGNIKTFDKDNRITTDTMGRKIEDPLTDPLNWSRPEAGTTQPYIVKGLNNTDITYNLVWEELEDVFEKQNTQALPPGFDKCTGVIDVPVQGATLFTKATAYEVRGSTPTKVVEKQRVCAPGGQVINPVVLSKVQLPNSQEYDFKYNEYGEITKITYPTGGYERFEYGQVNVIGTSVDAVYGQTNRGVKKRFLSYDGISEEPPTVYDTTYATSSAQPDSYYSVTAPDGSKTERTIYTSHDSRFGFDDPLAGRIKETRTFDALGGLRSRTLNKYIVEDGRGTNAHPKAKRDPRLEKSISIVFEPNNASALMARSKTEFDSHTEDKFFAHLNPTKSESTHYVAINDSTAKNLANDFDFFDAYFDDPNNNVEIASKTETEYTYDLNYLSKGILGLPTASFVYDPNIQTPDKNNNAHVLAKTQTIYDYSNSSGNTNAYAGDFTYSGIAGDMYFDDPTNEIKCWEDQSNTLKARPTTQRLWDDDNQIWIESHTQYDIFGNGVKTKDHLNRESTVEFDLPNKYAYPIRTISPAPGDGTNGTDQPFKTETTYDFMTGLITETRDLRVNGDPNDDLVSNTEYDAYMRPIAIVSGPASVSYANRIRAETEYDPNGLWVKSRSQFDTNTWNEAITYADGLGRTYKTRTVDSNGDVIVESKFDNMGRVTDVTNPYREGTDAADKLWVHTKYDEAGRVETVYAPEKDSVPIASRESTGSNEYGIINNVNGITGVWTVSTDASGRKSRSVSNSLGQLERVDEATSFGGSIDNDLGPISNPHQPTFYKYNIKGEMVEVTQGKVTEQHQKRNFLYDSLGRLIRVKQPEQEVNTTFNKTDPVTGNSTWTARFKYDAAGRLEETEDAEGTIITNTYDNADRVLTRTYSDGTPTVSYKYDLIPNGKGALIETSNSVSTSKTTQIDQWGRPTEYQQITKVGYDVNVDCSSQPTNVNCASYISTYKYNLSGALIEEEYPSGKKIKNEFDDNGDVERVWGTNGTANQLYANSFNYTASGGISAMRLGNGQWETAKFNNRLQVEELGLGNSIGNPNTWKVNYEFGEYDPVSQTVTGSKNTGNIARQTISFDGLPNSFVQTYQYDSLYRLTEANEMAGTTQTENWSEKFEYDRYGNRIKKYKNGVEITNDALSHPTIDPNTNRFTSNGYGYDKVGNLVTDPEGRTFTFDGNNKQRLVYDGAEAIGEYFYDGDGKRIKKHLYTAGSHTKTIIYVYSGGKLIEEYSTDPPPQGNNAKTKYLTEDHLGTPRVITDQNGQVVSRRDFMPFGEQIANTTGTRSDSSFKYSSNEDDVRQKFTGYQQDGETMLDFAEARMYENRHARFTAVDPLLASGKSSNPQTFNRYVYVMNSPLVFIDPDGKDPVYMVLRGKKGSKSELWVYLNTDWKKYKSLRKYWEKKGYEDAGNVINQTRQITGKSTFIKFTAKGFKEVNIMNPNNKPGNGPSKDYQTGFDMAGAVTSNLTFGYVTFGADENSEVFQRLGMAITLVQLKSLGTLGVKGAVNIYTLAKSGDEAVNLAKTLQSIYKANPCESGRCIDAARKTLEAFKEAGIEGAKVVRIGDDMGARQLITKDGKVVSEFGFHEVVKVGDRYFDALTGPDGLTLDEYRKLWKYEVTPTPKIPHPNLRTDSNIPGTQ